MDGVLYSLEAKDPHDMSRLWQILQIVFYVCSIILSFSIIVYFSDVMKVMKYNCILEAELFLTQATDFEAVNAKNVSCVIDIVHSKFYERPCDVVMFIPVIIITLALFFTSLFVMCGKGGAGIAIPDAWRLVFPTIILNSISFCMILYAAIVFQNGVKIFISSIKQAWLLHEIDLSKIHCLQVDDQKIGERLSSGLMRARLSVWLLVAFSALGLVWIILRFLFAIDFQLVQVINQGVPSPNNETAQELFVQDNKDSESEVSDESFHTAQTDLSVESQVSVTSRPKLQRTVRFKDNSSPLYSHKLSQNVRDVSVSTNISFPVTLHIPEKNKDSDQV